MDWLNPDIIPDNSKRPTFVPPPVVQPVIKRAAQVLPSFSVTSPSVFLSTANLFPVIDDNVFINNKETHNNITPFTAFTVDPPPQQNRGYFPDSTNFTPSNSYFASYTASNGGGGGTPSNWSIYPAISTVQGNNQSILGVSTLTAQTVIASTSFTQLANISTTNTQNIIVTSGSIQLIDSVTSANNKLKSIGNNLYFDDVLVATENSISSIGDWSLYPAISTVQLDGEDLSGVGTLHASFMTIAQINPTPGFSNIIFNYDNVPGMTYEMNGELKINYLSPNTTTQPNFTGGIGLGSGTGDPGAITYGQLQTDPTATNLTWNTQPITTGNLGIASNWSQYAAYSGVVDMSGSNLDQVQDINQNATGVANLNNIGVSGSIYQDPVQSTILGNTIINNRLGLIDIGTNLSVPIYSLNNVLYYNNLPVASGGGSNVGDWSYFPVLNSNGIIGAPGITNLIVGSNNKGTIIYGDTIGLNSETNILIDNDAGSSLSGSADISLTSGNGLYGAINLTANPGNGISFEQGGLINLVANSAGGVTTLALSRVNAEAATVTISAGALGALAYVPGAVNILSGLGTGIYLLTTAGPINIAAGTATTVTGGTGVFLDGGATGVKVQSNVELWVNNIRANGSNTTRMINGLAADGVFPYLTNATNISSLDCSNMTVNTLQYIASNLPPINVSTVSSFNTLFCSSLVTNRIASSNVFPNDYIEVDGYLNLQSGYGIVSDFPLTISSATVNVTGALIGQDYIRSEGYLQAYGNLFLMSNNSGFDNFNPAIIRCTGADFQVSTVYSQVVNTSTIFSDYINTSNLINAGGVITPEITTAFIYPTIANGTTRIIGNLIASTITSDNISCPTLSVSSINGVQFPQSQTVISSFNNLFATTISSAVETVSSVVANNISSTRGQFGSLVTGPITGGTVNLGVSGVANTITGLTSLVGGAITIGNTGGTTTFNGGLAFNNGGAMVNSGASARLEFTNANGLARVVVPSTLTRYISCAIATISSINNKVFISDDGFGGDILGGVAVLLADQTSTTNLFASTVSAVNMDAINLAGQFVTALSGLSVPSGNVTVDIGDVNVVNGNVVAPTVIATTVSTQALFVSSINGVPPGSISKFTASNGQVIATNTLNASPTSVIFDTITYNFANLSLTSNTSQITIGDTGYYQLQGSVRWPNVNNGQRAISFFNSTTTTNLDVFFIPHQGTGNGDLNGIGIGTYPLNSGDVIQMRCGQSSGGNITLSNARFNIYKIR